MPSTSVRNYAILYPKRRVDPSGAGVAAGGNALLSTDAHDLDGPEHLHPDSYVKSTLGGEETKKDNGNVTGTATLDLALGNYHIANLTGDCTFSITGANSGYGDGFTVKLTGSHVASWYGAVTTGDTDPGTGTRFWGLVTDDGGSTWHAFLIGGGAAFATPAIVLGTAAAAGAATTVIRSDATIVAFDATAPTTSALGDSAATGSQAVAARRDHRHGREAFGTTATDVAGVGVASAGGSATTPSKSDHKHALTYHDEPLTDGASNFIFDGGDIIVVTGVPN